MKVNSLRIEDVCDFVGGSQPPKADFIFEPREGYVRLIQTRDYKTDSFVTYIPENSTQKFCDEKDIMIGRYGPPIFQICRGLNGAYNVALLKAKPKNNIDREYLYYFLKQESVFQYVDKLSARTGGQTGVDLVSLNEYPIRLPENIEDQKKLVAILYAIDAKIELNNRINAELDAMAKTLYDYWFVQFDFPFDFDQDKPAANGKPYKSSGGKMLYNPTLKREIPEGWQSKKLETVTSTIRRGISPKYVEDRGFPVLNQKCIRDQRIQFGDCRYHSTELQSNDERLLRFYDVLVNSTGVGTLGRVAFVKRLLEKNTTVDSHVTIVRTDSREITPEYLAWTMLRYQSVIESAANGSTGQVELNKSFVENLDIVIPEETIQKRFSSFIEPLVKEIATREREIDLFTELRDWLLPMLMNGQVAVQSAATD